MNISRQQNEKLDALAEVDRACDAFEAAWRDNQSPLIADYLAKVSNSELRLPLFRELLALDIEFRRAQGEQISREDYRYRFPDLVEALVTQESQLQQTTPNSEHQTTGLEESPKASLTERPFDAALQDGDEAPLKLSDYHIQSRLGSGGQGDVYLAQQRSLGRRVAIKLLRHSSADDPQLEPRFLREARTLAQASHPHIVTIHGIGRSPNNELFLVMEYIAGDDLAKQIAQKRFPINQAVEILLKIAGAIEHAHAQGVIHRDLKPSNVLWHEIRGPVVTDFGLAKDMRAADALTATEQMMGTPTYMAPEQAHRRFGEISERTDVYGLAATLYALLTGQPPIASGPMMEVLCQLASDTAITDPREYRPEIDPALSTICMKALAKYSAGRYPTIATFSEDLRSWLREKSHRPAPPETTQDFIAPPKPQTNLAPGGQFGRFRLLELLTRDPSYKVFRAKDDAENSVLLKCLPPDFLKDARARSHFRQEVLLASQVSHPCLAKVIEAGTLHQTEYAAFEYVEGQSLSEQIADQGKITEPEAIEILKPIAEALHLLHQAGIVYRDLRPQNIFRDPEGQPRLADIRSSRQDLSDCTLAPDRIGLDLSALPYQPPEFWLNQTETTAMDIYMLGGTLFTMLTGEPPFADDSDHIRLMLAKNAGRFTPPRSLAPNLSEGIRQLIESCLQPSPSNRPSTALEFRDRLAACHQNPRLGIGGAVPTDTDNLLHSVWDQLDPELQDAFSLAYNKKRRTGSTRISTKDLFEAMVRLGMGPLRNVFDQLPSGALPEAAPADIPKDRVLLSEQPLLSDCVRESLTEFGKLAPGRDRVTSVDLFVDVAKHGHGSSVVRLREHGVDPEAIERIVQRLGLRIVRRESVAGLESSSPNQADNKYLSDENVQFSVFRPKAIPPESWQPLLAFAHLSELPKDAPPETPDPIQEVQRQAEQILGKKLQTYTSLTADSAQAIPQSSELSFVPSGDGLTFNPPQRSFLWKESVHREEFRFKAASHLDGQVARGRLSVYLGRMLIAEVSLVIRVDSKLAEDSQPAAMNEARARRFRRIYASVARDDRDMISEFKRYAELLNDRFLTTQFDKDSASKDTNKLIRSADVFQLYWSNRALRSEEVQREWQYALSLNRSDFIRPLYWEEPFPTDPVRSLPPPELLALGFQKLPGRDYGPSQAESPDKSTKPSHIRERLRRVRSPRSERSTEDSDACLEILTGTLQGRRYLLNKAQVSIGRSTEADVYLDSRVLSKHHALLTNESNEWYLEDLNSSNGTYVNGCRIDGSVQLRDGDEIRLGDVLTMFRSSMQEPCLEPLSSDDSDVSKPHCIPDVSIEPEDPWVHLTTISASDDHGTEYSTGTFQKMSQWEIVMRDMTGACQHHLKPTRRNGQDHDNEVSMSLGSCSAQLLRCSLQPSLPAYGTFCRTPIVGRFQSDSFRINRRIHADVPICSGSNAVYVRSYGARD